MTLPSGSNNPPISMTDINTEFSLGRNLDVYRNTRWYKSDNSRGFFPTTPISFSDFYGTRKTSPVTSGSTTINSSQNLSFPMFNNLTATVVSGGGGTDGAGGNCAGAGAGSPGGDSSWGNLVSATGGARNSYNGNTSTRSWSITDANQASILALYGTTQYGTVGSGGARGNTGYYTRSEFVCTRLEYYQYFPYVACTAGYTAYYCDQAAGYGSTGVTGYIQLSWT